MASTDTSILDTGVEWTEDEGPPVLGPHRSQLMLPPRLRTKAEYDHLFPTIFKRGTRLDASQVIDGRPGAPSIRYTSKFIRRERMRVRNIQYNDDPPFGEPILRPHLRPRVDTWTDTEADRRAMISRALRTAP